MSICKPLLLLLITTIVTNLSVTAANAQSSETLIDRIVVAVDGKPLLYSDINDKVKNGPLVVVSDYPVDDKAEPFQRALNDAINFELVMQKARDLEIDVRNEEVEAEIKAFLETRGLGREGLNKHLQEEGLTYEDYKSDFRDQMILRRFQGKVIFPLLKVTDRDLETYYLKKQGTSSDVVELALRQILFSVAANSAPEIVEAKRKLASEVSKKLVDGLNFVEAVKVYSDDAEARKTGGLMPPIKSKDLAPVIRSEVETLEKGQFTPAVRTSLGFHIFFLEDKHFSGSSEFLAQKKQLEFEVRNLELNNQTRRWLTEQRQRSKIELVKD